MFKLALLVIKYKGKLESVAQSYYQNIILYIKKIDYMESC